MKKYLIFILLAALVGGAIAYFIANKPHKDMASAEADITIEAAALLAAFESDENAANSQYLDKVVAVKGNVSEVTTSEDGAIKVTLDTGNPMSGVICELDKLSKHPRTDFPVGEAVVFKGNCTGMLMDVVLVRCVEVK